jgi:hypothetical protein
MSGAIPPLPQYASMAWCSVKAEGQLTFSFYLICIEPFRAWEVNIHAFTELGSEIVLGLTDDITTLSLIFRIHVPWCVPKDYNQ